jgi:hypothetical protein
MTGTLEADLLLLRLWVRDDSMCMSERNDVLVFGTPLSGEADLLFDACMRDVWCVPGCEELERERCDTGPDLPVMLVCDADGVVDVSVAE